MPYARHARSGKRGFFQTSTSPVAVTVIVVPVEVPISVFNSQVLDHTRRMSRAQTAVNGRTSRASRRTRDGGLRAHEHGHPKSMSVNITPFSSGSYPRKGETSRWSLSEQSTPKHYTYTHPLRPSKLPSCTSLPSTWCSTHDRFIAYLATHAPLEKGNRVPQHEEWRERWGTGDIVREVEVRFPELGGLVKATMIEKRLALLDLAGDNDYFKKPYGAYRHKQWGVGI